MLKTYYVRLTDIEGVTRHVDVPAESPDKAAALAIEQELYGLLGSPEQWVVRVFEPCPSHNVLEAVRAQ